jgi:hypothetical protein
MNNFIPCFVIPINKIITRIREEIILIKEEENEDDRGDTTNFSNTFVFKTTNSIER